MNIGVLWGFLRRNLLASRWFWVVMSLSLGAMYFKVPIFGPAGQVMFGLLISPFIIYLVWIVVLTVRIGGGGRWLILFGVCVVITLVVAMYVTSTPYKPPTRSTAAISPAPVQRQRLLHLEVDRMTPVGDSINYEFELDTQGDPIALRIPTIRGDTTVHYSGKGDLPFPHRTRVKGLVQITSSTAGQARVRIWRVEYR